MKANAFMKNKFFLFLLFSTSSLIYTSDENARRSTLDNQGNYGQFQHQQDAHLTELLHEVDEYETKVCESYGMITGALTGAGTMFVLAVSLKGILNPIALAILGVSMLPIQVGVGACIGKRCKHKVL